MTWFTENPWPPIFLLSIVACLMLAVWSSQKRRIWLMGAVAALLASIAVYFVARAIVTDRERVEANVRNLAAAFQRKDSAGTLAFFSVQYPDRGLIEMALRDVDVRNLAVKDMTVRLSNEDTRAVTRFRANGTVSYRGAGAGFHPSRWDVTWQKEGKDWKIIGVDRLDLLKDEKKGMFDPRGG